jgi:hypothetical protein
MIEEALTLEYLNKSMDVLKAEIKHLTKQSVEESTHLKAEIQHLTQESKNSEVKIEDLANTLVQSEAKIQHLTQESKKSEVKIEGLATAYGELKVQSANTLVHSEAKYGELKTYFLDSQKGNNN